MKWIPVTETPPESGKYLTMSADYHKVGHGWYNNKYRPGWEDDKEEYLPVTHWMPLPPTPDESSTSVDEDEIYEIDDIDTLREMLIKAKQSSKQWCQKAIEAARDRQQLSEHNKAIIKDLKETREQLADSQSSTSERTVNDIIHCSCILLGIDDKECSVCYPSSTEEESQSGEGDAVDELEWVRKNYELIDGDFYHKDDEDGYSPFSAKEIHKIYLQSNHS